MGKKAKKWKEVKKIINESTSESSVSQPSGSSIELEVFLNAVLPLPLFFHT